MLAKRCVRDRLLCVERSLRRLTVQCRIVNAIRGSTQNNPLSFHPLDFSNIHGRDARTRLRNVSTPIPRRLGCSTFFWLANLPLSLLGSPGARKHSLTLFWNFRTHLFFSWCYLARVTDMIVLLREAGLALGSSKLNLDWDPSRAKRGWGFYWLRSVDFFFLCGDFGRFLVENPDL